MEVGPGLRPFTFDDLVVVTVVFEGFLVLLLPIDFLSSVLVDCRLGLDEDSGPDFFRLDVLDAVDCLREEVAARGV